MKKRVDFSKLTESQIKKMMAGVGNRVAEQIIPGLIMDEGLAGTFLKDPFDTIPRLRKILKRHPDVAGDASVTHFYESLLDRASELAGSDDMTSREVCVLVAFSALEAAVNEEILEEMRVLGTFGREEAYKVVRELNLKPKISWLSVLLKGKDFSETKAWRRIAPFYKIRNQGIVHYKPILIPELERLTKPMTREGVKRLVADVRIFVRTFQQVRTPKLKEYYVTLKKVELTLGSMNDELEAFEKLDLGKLEADGHISPAGPARR